MKSTLNLDSLHLTIRGVSAETATAAVRGLGPALTRELGAGAKTADGRTAHVPRNVSTVSLQNTLATHVAGALRPHLPAAKH